jgi:hypothetical protein
LRRELQTRIVIRKHRVCPRLGDFDVSEVEERGEKLEDVPLPLDGYSDGR